MIIPPFSGTFSRPLNSILKKPLLTAPTTGLIESSAHCGNGERSGDARGSSRFAAVPLLPMFRPFILQRPFPINKLHMNSRNAINASASRSNRRVSRDAVLLARESNKTSLRDLQRRENCRAFRADVFSHCVFTHHHFTIEVHQFHQHIYCDVVTRVRALIRRRKRGQNIVSRSECLESGG